MSSSIPITTEEMYRYTYTTQKVKHSCSHCGFEAVLFESNAAGYECPVCHIGVLGRVPNIIIGPSITIGPSEVK